jgi:hypothetical protein
LPHRTPRAPVLIALVAAAVLAACGSDSPAGPSTGTDPIQNPSGVLNLGDVVTLNVNGTDPCVSPILHGARVVAIGSKAMILNDTLNPKNGFSTADFQKFAAKFDTIIYPMDVENFGEPTDIDKNGHIIILFTRAVNELTPAHSSQYVGGFAFSRDLFPAVGTVRAQGCPGSNQGEYFYALTPDPTGSVNANIRTTGFVDSVTTSVLAHEFQHIINASRHLYVNNAPAFEEKWLDEGLAHVAEELLFYREGGVAPRSNLDLNAIRATTVARNAFNLDMNGNQGRYRSYLTSPSTSSPYAADDSLPTRGAAWSLLRYSVDRLDANDGFAAGTGQVITGAGAVALPAGAASGEYSVTVANTTLQNSGTISYTMQTTPSGASSSVAAESFVPAPVRVPLVEDPNALHQDVAFESALRTRERAVLTPMIGSARSWYASQPRVAPSATRVRASLSLSSAADADAAIWFRLVNSMTVGFTNLNAVVGGGLAGFMRDWSVSHAIDDVAAPSTQYQQRSWSWHSIYSNSSAAYPLQVQTISTTATVNASVVAGGAAFYRIVVPANGGVTVSLNSTNANLQLVIVKTK